MMMNPVSSPGAAASARSRGALNALRGDGTPWCRRGNLAVSRKRNPASVGHHSIFSAVFLALTFVACFFTSSASAFQLPFFNNPSLGTNSTMSAQKYSLPPLPYAYDALEPAISAQIMELHHSKHHQTYITNLNAALSSLAAASAAADIPTQIALQQALRFHGGGHINHALFWENLTPPTSPEAKLDDAVAPQLRKKIVETWGSEAKFKEAFAKALLGIQGSGWGWLVKFEGEGGRLGIVTTKDQDPIVGPGEVPIFGVDMWEHAYYLQYLNGKAAYVENIWTVINWKTAEERFLGTRGDAFKVLKASI